MDGEGEDFIGELLGDGEVLRGVAEAAIEGLAVDGRRVEDAGFDVAIAEGGLQAVTGFPAGADADGVLVVDVRAVG